MAAGGLNARTGDMSPSTLLLHRGLMASNNGLWLQIPHLLGAQVQILTAGHPPLVFSGPHPESSCLF